MIPICLQGNLIGDSSDFLVEPNNHLLLINTELYFRRGRTDIKIFYSKLDKRVDIDSI